MRKRNRFQGQIQTTSIARNKSEPIGLFTGLAHLHLKLLTIRELLTCSISQLLPVLLSLFCPALHKLLHRTQKVRLLDVSVSWASGTFDPFAWLMCGKLSVAPNKKSALCNASPRGSIFHGKFLVLLETAHPTSVILSFDTTKYVAFPLFVQRSLVSSLDQVGKSHARNSYKAKKEEPSTNTPALLSWHC